MATVSKVLNGKPDVSVRTRALVRQALLTSGYRKRANDDAPPLIDVVFNDFDSPWAIEIVRGAAAAAQAEGLTIAFTALSEGDEQLVQRPTTSPRPGQVGRDPTALAPHLSHGDVCGIANEWRFTPKAPRQLPVHRRVHAHLPAGTTGRRTARQARRDCFLDSRQSIGCVGSVTELPDRPTSRTRVTSAMLRLPLRAYETVSVETSAFSSACTTTALDRAPPCLVPCQRDSTPSKHL